VRLKSAGWHEKQPADGKKQAIWQAYQLRRKNQPNEA
jgi:hypothetical protein